MKTKYMSKKVAKEIIALENEIHETAYCDGTLKVSVMKELLRYRLGFGKSETNFIIASLVNAGAKFLI